MNPIIVINLVPFILVLASGKVLSKLQWTNFLNQLCLLLNISWTRCCLSAGQNIRTKWRKTYAPLPSPLRILLNFPSLDLQRLILSHSHYLKMMCVHNWHKRNPLFCMEEIIRRSSSRSTEPHNANQWQTLRMRAGPLEVTLTNLKYSKGAHCWIHFFLNLVGCFRSKWWLNELPTVSQVILYIDPSLSMLRPSAVKFGMDYCSPDKHIRNACVLRLMTRARKAERFDPMPTSSLHGSVSEEKQVTVVRLQECR